MIARQQVEKTTAEWEIQNPTLADNVIGVEIMTTGYLRYKRGNGITAWRSLPYLDRIPPMVDWEGEYSPVQTVNGIPPDENGNVDLGIFTFWVGTRDDFNNLTPDAMYDDQIIHFIIEGE